MNTTALYRGKRNYELSNHLGNVQMVISDKRKSVCDEELGVEYFVAEVLSAVDYYPFGMLMIDRQWYAGNDSSSYRYGFNGQEKDNEVKGSGNSLDYKLRIYDSRLARFLSIDPLTQQFPFYSPYQFAANSPIKHIDLDGAEAYGPAYPAAGVPHLRYTFTADLTSFNEKKQTYTRYYKTATAHNTSPSGLEAANKMNAQNGGKGVLVNGSHYNREKARLWQMVDGPTPPSLSTNTHTETTTTSFNGSQGNHPGETTNRRVTIPTGDAVSSATFSYDNGGAEANSFLITDATTGAFIASVPATAGNGTITLPNLSAGQTINIQQTPSLPGNTTDTWVYSLRVVTTNTTTTTTMKTSNEPTVSSPGEDVNPLPTVVNTPTTSSSSSSETETTEGR